MTHHRIRTTNTRGSFLAPDLDFGISETVVADDQVFLGGCTGLTLDGTGFKGEGDPGRQAEVAMQTVRELLADAGSTIDDVCKITTYLSGPSHHPQIYPVVGRHLDGVYPVSTGLVMQGLSRPELDFEMDVFAVAPTGEE